MTINQSTSHLSTNPSLQMSPISVASPLAAIPSFDNKGLDPTQVSLSRLQQIIDLLDNSLRLPNNPRTFAVYVLGLAIVFTGAFMHVLIAAQIMQAEFTLHQLQEEYRALEQQNGDIIFQIARDTNMERLQERVVADGYVQVQDRRYVFVPSETVAAAATLAENSAEAAVQPALATQPAQTTLASVGSGLGQFARWEEFWNSLLTPVTSAGVAASAPATTAASTKPAKNDADFWSVWWQQATERGEKLLDGLRSQ